MIKNLNKFLSVNHPLKSSILAVEGFLPDYTLRNMLTEFYAKDYKKLVILGKPIGQGYYLNGYQTSADLMKATLVNKMGMDSSLVSTISIPGTVKKDQTYSTGLILSYYLDTIRSDAKKINVYTMGSHARRSKILFQAALGKDIKVGIISGEDRSYDQLKWWKSSKGFRTVFNEALAYVYVKLLFKSDRENDLNALMKGYYVEEIEKKRNTKDFSFSMDDDSPLKELQKTEFIHLEYYPVDPKYEIKAFFTAFLSPETEYLKTSSSDSIPYTKAGILSFEMDTNNLKLTAYHHPKKNNLFIPFNDLSYSAKDNIYGRCLDLESNIKDSIWINLNLIYNPLSAYNQRFKSPRPPKQNNLNISIEAGEKSYRTH